MDKQEDFDLTQFVDMFDTAMSSDNPAIQKCFKNLLLLVSLVHTEDKQKQIGPLRKLVEDVHDLQRRVSQMEYNNSPFNGAKYSSCEYTVTSTAGLGYVAPNSGAYSTTITSTTIN